MFSCSHQCQRMFINFPHISKEIETPHVHHYVHHFSPCFHQFSEKNHLQHVQFSSHVQISKCLEFQNVTQISIYIYISTTKRCTCPIFSPKFHPFPARLGQVRRDAVTWNSAADAVSRSSDAVQWALSLEWLGMKGCGMTMSGLYTYYDI